MGPLFGIESSAYGFGRRGYRELLIAASITANYIQPIELNQVRTRLNNYQELITALRGGRTVKVVQDLAQCSGFVGRNGSAKRLNINGGKIDTIEWFVRSLCSPWRVLQLKTFRAYPVICYLSTVYLPSLKRTPTSNPPRISQKTFGD
eukprot:TRINITY_DN4673_c0_g2_i1.p2 TRINITY_DN4673_c0_g2~~TRINITY_DN4673_c0_g2_i1.p2  ORF type:complete len:148 (+),score=2.80 TRINITY_DN4673_c0_g2_i1:502-945(+)